MASKWADAPVSFDVQYSNEAVAQLRKLRAYDRSAILDQIEAILAVNPTVESKARVKKLKQPAPTQFRLRVGEFRVYYDVDQNEVRIIQILDKIDAIQYLEDFP